VANLCNYDHFNWLSTITDFYFYGQPSNCIAIPGLLISIRCTGVDPTLGGIFGLGTSDYYPPYYNEVSCLLCASNLLYSSGDNQEVFVDAPNFIQAGWAAHFTTQLIGVRADHTYDILTDVLGYPGLTFRWEYTQTRTCSGLSENCGNTALLANTDPSLGGGGQVNFLGFGEEPTTLPLTSGQSCNGSFNGAFSGNVTVSAGQNCTFTDNCEIQGSVTVNGGSFNLACAVDGNVTVNDGTLVIGPSAKVGGNVQISQASDFNLGPGAGIGGNLQIQQLPAALPQGTVCTIQVKGNLQAQSDASPIEIGGMGAQSCGGNTVGGNLAVNNSGAAQIDGNTVGGNLTVSNNTAAAQVDYNTVGGNLAVDGNSATTDVSANSVGGNLQCQNDTTVSYVAPIW